VITNTKDTKVTKITKERKVCSRRKGRCDVLRVQSPLDEMTETVMRECIGCAVAVHRALGPGYLESIYRNAMRVELLTCGLTVDEERCVDVIYRDEMVGRQRIDVIVAGVIILELKAIDQIESVHTAQVVSYLHAAKLRAGLLINFRVPLLKQGVRRIVI
jgi:GxxExxY protein